MYKKLLLLVLVVATTSLISFISAYFYLRNEGLTNKLLSPQVKQIKQDKVLPLLAYSIDHLAKQQFVAQAPISVEKIIASDKDKQIYTLLFKYQSQGKNVSGALNLKLSETELANKPKATILMIRGFVPAESYFTGAGSKNTASVLADHGYLTIAPDFLGFGESNPEPSNTWEARFIKVVNILDLLATIQQFPEIDLSNISDLPIKKITIDPNKIGIWAHSNGGQIAVTTLEVLDRNLPTTLWAPVLAPFPYSILYFSDEYADEGKETRKYVSLFEEDYDVFDFSLTRHLDRLHGPIQIQHGTNDDSALVSWTEEFLAKVDLENVRRATEGGELTSEATDPLTIEFHKYPGANHNLQPNWNEAIQRDLSFFERNLNTQ